MREVSSFRQFMLTGKKSHVPVCSIIIGERFLQFGIFLV